jgi:hypothetical protein
MPIPPAEAVLITIEPASAMAAMMLEIWNDCFKVNLLLDC